MPSNKMGPAAWAAIVVALPLHLAAGFFYVTSGLVAPLWAVLLLLLIWVALGIAGFRNKHRPLYVLAVPVAAALVWLLIVQGGSTLFGWTA
ncbi:MAG TPA: hypothetical protein VHJ78_05350 [Actinomycetota bacterium]|nr:hypothetical protein [Actinomycetota bacterium]